LYFNHLVVKIQPPDELFLSKTHGIDSRKVTYLAVRGNHIRVFQFPAIPGAQGPALPDKEDDFKVV